MALRWLALALLLAACGPMPPAAQRSDAQMPLPAVKRFASAPDLPVRRSNTEIAQDFLDLFFRLESGRQLARFTRIEGPIALRVVGRRTPLFDADLDALLERLRHEAKLPISRTESSDAQITIELVSRRAIRQVLPQAACFVIPNVSSMREFRQLRGSAQTDWARLETRARLALFIPRDTSPQEQRDCLHEELAQALGPLNDLYRLRDSVFNDDNVHAVLTGFDTLILRAAYDPALRSGQSRAEVAALLPGVLQRLNPGGARPAAMRPAATDRRWINAMQTALGPGANIFERRRAARAAVSIAGAARWRDHRTAFSHEVLARVEQPFDPDGAHARFGLALRMYEVTGDTAPYQAQISVQLAGYALAQGDARAVLAYLEGRDVTARQHQNAALLATILLLRAEALQLLGQTDAAQATRVDSLGWARYGFGDEAEIRARMRDIAQLARAGAGG